MQRAIIDYTCDLCGAEETADPNTGTWSTVSLPNRDRYSDEPMKTWDICYRCAGEINQKYVIAEKRAEDVPF